MRRGREGAREQGNERVFHCECVQGTREELERERSQEEGEQTGVRGGVREARSQEEEEEDGEEEEKHERHTETGIVGARKTCPCHSSVP